MQNSILSPNTPHVVAEDFDNEVIIVNLYNGNYYSLRDSAAVIWKLIAQKPLYNQLLDAIASVYGVSSDALSDVVQDFISHLEKDHMIKIEAPNGHITTIPTLQAVSTPFEAPRLEVYSDMQDLLLLDPIHEVDENKGWPEKK